MGISSLQNRSDYTGNNSTAVYAYAFKIQSNTHLLVTKRDTNNVETTLVLTTDYTVSPTGVNNENGGTITLVAGNLPTDYKLTIRRVVPLTQDSDFRNQGDFFPESHENAFDLGVMGAQQQQDEINRSIRVPETVSTDEFDPSLPATITPNAYLAINSTGKELTLISAAITDGITLPAGNGIISKVNNTSNLRVITGTTDEITVTDGDGVSGNPTVSIPASYRTETVTAAITAAYPVGSIYINAAVNTNPATLLGIGTWVEFGSGRVMVGVDAAQTEFDVLEETGGDKTHTLTAAEMPEHNHFQSWTDAGAVTSSGGPYLVTEEWGQNYATHDRSYSGITGNGGAHNNLQPYITVYMWKRTA